MSRILKRPMFRKGGQVEEGIIKLATGGRAMYQGGTTLDPNDPLLQKAMRNKAILEQMTGGTRDTKQDVYDLLISGGLNLIGGVGAGDGTLASVARSFKEPTEKFLAKRPGEEAFQRQLGLAAAQGAISSDEATRLARIRAQKEYAKDKLLSQERRQLDTAKELTKIYGPLVKDGMELRPELIDRESISKISKSLVDIEKGEIKGPGGKPLQGANVSIAPIVDGKITNQEYLDPKTKEPNRSYYKPGRFYVNHDGSIYLYQGKNNFKRIDGYQGQ